MKIVIFSQRFFPENASINEVSSLLIDRGHNITVMTGLPNAPAGKIFKGYGPFTKVKEYWKNIDIRRNWLIPKGNGSSKRLSLNYLSFALFSSVMLPRLRGIKPDIIFVNQLTPITQAIPAILYKKITGASLAMWVHDLWPESVASSGAINNKYAISVIGKLVDYIYKHCDIIYVQSQAMNNKIEERGVSPDKIHYLPNPIDPIFKPTTKTKINSLFSNIPEKSFIIMFAGNIGRSQDLPTIIEAAKILKNHQDIHWVFVGDGRSLDESKEMATSYDLVNTHFIGGHPLEKMPLFYSVANLMLVTLLNEEIYSLTVPLKTQSYLACAKPVICNVPGEATRIINEAKAGFTLPPENPTMLAEKVLEAYNLPKNKLDQKGKNARKYFEAHYEQYKIIDFLENSLKKLAETDTIKYQH